MRCYAGIGSRTLNHPEHEIIANIAKNLSQRGFWLYSGHADGADITFEKNSSSGVIWLPWKGFNSKHDLLPEMKYRLVERTTETEESVNRFHPAPHTLSSGVRKLMMRNYHQIMGSVEFPCVKFVVCCADPQDGGVKGGTGQAVRIANFHKIPVVNIRSSGWRKVLKELLDVHEKKTEQETSVSKEVKQ